MKNRKTVYYGVFELPVFNQMLVDIGANLTHESFKDDIDLVLLSARKEEISHLVVTGASLTGSFEALSLAEAYPDLLYATAGIHPHHAEETNEEALTKLRILASNEKVKAIGETGLDFFRDLSPRDVQVQSFEAHIELAIETGLPMFLHERDAYPTFAEVLKKYRNQLGQVVVHCFTGERAAMHAYLDLDCSIGITGWICDERRGVHLLDLVKDIPDDRLMIETDSPYLMPRTIRPKPKTRRNEPKNLTYVCDTIAQCRGQSYAKVASLSSANAIKFFGLAT